MMTATRRKDEQGAYAVLFGILVVVLASMAALAIDIGNAVARKADMQGQADFAALGAGAQLTSNTGLVPSTEVLNEARALLNKNRARNWGDDCSSGPMCITSNLQLINGDTSDGEVRFANGGLQVLTPFETVDFSVARVMGFTDTDVQGDATVGVFSPLGVMPVYAVNPCDYGRQTITDPANGQVQPVDVPTLAHDADTNGTTLATVTPNQIDLNETGVILSLAGKDWQRTVRVGFFPADGSAPIIATEFTDPSGGVHPYTPDTPYTQTGSRTITLPVPLAVSSTESVYYLRVFNLDAPDVETGKWSDKHSAPAFRVGEAVLECDAGSSDGNFGALLLPRTDESSVNDQLAMNMADGLQEPLTLTVHAGADATGLCQDGVNGAVFSALPNPGQRPGTNCVDTDTGLPANGTTAGMITGEHIGAPGRLTTQSTMAGCNGGTNRTVNLPSPYSINNDVLTCYLSDGTTSLADIATPHYSGGPALDSSIYDAPRFFFVPVLHIEPSSGGSDTYSIVDFRPAFLTDEAVASTSIKGSSSATADNGVVIEQNQIKQMKVIFFNIDALPAYNGGEVTDYMGVGPRILRLID